LSLNSVTNSLTSVAAPQHDKSIDWNLRRSTVKLLKPSSEEAEVIALRALAFLASDVSRLGRFLALSGIDPADMREAAASRLFLAGVLNHLLQDESLLLSFVGDQDLDPRLPGLAAETLLHAD
jgi:hypothetical protein